jgi:hypothetical protein
VIATTAPALRCPRLPRLPGGWLGVGLPLVVAGLAGALRAEGNPPTASVYARQPAAPAAAGPSGVTGGAAAAAPPDSNAKDAAAEAAQAERIVASSLATIARAESVSVRVRQRVRLGDRVLVGTGRYLQAGQGEEQRFRFDSTLTCDSEVFETTEVSDGLFCWAHRRIGPDPPTLHRIDIQRVRSQLEKLGASDPSDTAAYLGGIQRSLWWMRQWFRFSKAQVAEVGGRAVWIIDGHWPAGVLTLLLPELAEAAKRPEGVRPEELPDGFPWSVRLAVGQSDLVPLQLEFLAIPGARPVTPGPLEPIAVIEFLEVELNGPVDATAFYYQPAAQEMIDLTNHAVKTMSLMRP